MRTLIAIVLTAAAATTALAQTRSETFTYQGVLEDNGVPYTGTVDMVFLFYDRPVGGLLLASAAVPGVQVNDGLFVAEYLAPSPPALTPLWLEIGVTPPVGPSFLLTPRQRMRPAPFAANATGAEKLADGTVVFQRQASLTTAESFDGSDDETAPSATQTFVATRTGRPTTAFVLVAGGGTGTARIYDGPNTSGELLASAPISGFEFTFATFETPNELIAGRTYTLEVVFPAPLFWQTSNSDPYPDGRSSFGSGSDLIFQIQVESPDVPVASVSPFGTARLRGLEVTGNGDFAVQLPANSINSTEILDEPGVAADFGFGRLLSTTLTTESQQSISVPGPGFVLVNFTGELLVSHVNGTTSNVYFGVSNSAGVISPSNNDMQVSIPSVMPTGNYEHSIAAQGLYSVSSSGSFTAYLNMNRGGAGSARLEDYGLTLLYVPGAYGATSVRAPGDGLETPND